MHLTKPAIPCITLCGTHFVTGIRKNGRESNDKSFFKLEMVNMDKNYSFAIFVDSDLEEKDFIKETIGYLGKKKNPFAVTAKPWNNVGVYNGTEPIEVFLQEVRNAFSGLQTQQKYYLALSDVLLKERVFNNGFAIVEKKQIRNIETDYDAKKYNDKFKRSSCRFNLISAGSVFYEEPGFDYNNSDLKKAGYNNIVEIGG